MRLQKTTPYLTCVLSTTSKALLPMHCTLRHAEDTRLIRIAVPYAHPHRQIIANPFVLGGEQIITAHWCRASFWTRCPRLRPTFETARGPFQGCTGQVSKSGMIILRKYLESGICTSQLANGHLAVARDLQLAKTVFAKMANWVTWDTNPTMEGIVLPWLPDDPGKMRLRCGLQLCPSHLKSEDSVNFIA